MPNRPHLSGWCRSAMTIEREPHRSKEPAESFHARCKGGWERPDIIEKGPNNKVISRTPAPPVFCVCECHADQEIVPVGKQTLTADKIKASKPGKRNSQVLDDIIKTLTERGELQLDAPEDPKELKSKRERIYTAARKAGMKVKVVVRDGKIQATRK